MYKKKKGQQSGSQAAILILLITAAIIIYIMFLPADERRELLDDDYTSSSSGSSNNNDDSTDYNLTLVDESPGRLDYIARDEYTHEIPAVNLYSTTDAKVLKSVSPFVVKNNWFEKKPHSIEFSLTDPDNSDNLQLSFGASTHTGILTITLNGYTIYEGETSTSTMNPIYLPIDQLSRSNSIDFSVSGVGAAFWKTNKWSLSNIMITGDVTDNSNHNSKNIFSISSTEFFNLEDAELKFATDCEYAKIGKLNIYVNGDSIYSAVPDCGQRNPSIDITKSVNPGTNELKFLTEKGQILIDQIVVQTNLKELPYPVYYFDLDDEMVDDIEANNTDLNLTLDFTDDYNFKEAKIYINGIRTYMTTREDEYIVNIKPYIEEGTNSIKVEPYGDMIEIRKLLVYLD